MDKHARQAVNATNHILARRFREGASEIPTMSEIDAGRTYKEANDLVARARNDYDLRTAARLFGVTLSSAIDLNDLSQVAGAYNGLTMCFRSYTNTHPNSMLDGAIQILDAIALDLREQNSGTLADLCMSNAIVLKLARYSTPEEDSSLLAQAEEILRRRDDARDRLYTQHTIAILKLRVRPQDNQFQWLVSAKKELRRCARRLASDLSNDQMVLGYAEVGRAEIAIRRVLHSQALATSVSANLNKLPTHLRKQAGEKPGRIAGVLASNPEILGLAERPPWLGKAAGVNNSLMSREDELRKCVDDLKGALSKDGLSQHSRHFGQRILLELEWERSATSATFNRVMEMANSEWMLRNPTELVTEICPIVFAARSALGILPPLDVLKAISSAYVRVISLSEQGTASHFVQDNPNAARFIAVLLGELCQWELAFHLLDGVRGREFLGGWAPPSQRAGIASSDLLTIHVTHNPESTLAVGKRAEGTFFGFVDSTLSGKHVTTIWARLQEFNRDLLGSSNAATYRDAIADAWTISHSLGKKVLPYLHESTERNVLLCPGGLYTAFPLWSAIAPECLEAGQALFVNVSSASVSAPTAITRTVTTVDASNALSSRPLVSGKSELTYIELLARVPSARRLWATPASSIRALRSSGIVHFCCHAVADVIDGLQSALILNEGNLSSHQILDSAPLGADLVVLNACESGLATTNRWADELMCIQTALMHAGCGRAVGCLWRIRDLPSALLMASFYERLLDPAGLPDGTSIVLDSLVGAQNWLRSSSLSKIEAAASRWSIDLSSLNARHLRQSDRPFDHPIYWAAYYLSSRVAAAPIQDLAPEKDRST